MAFSADEVAQINTDNGYNLYFETREDAMTRLAVMGWNVEGTTNNPDEENSKAVAEMRSVREPDAERVESALFADLASDWTATATVKSQKYNSSTGAYEYCIRLADSRVNSTNYAGHSLGVINAGQVADRLFSLTLKDSWVKDNCRLVVFVTTADNSVNNVIEASLTGNVAFEYE